MKKKLMAVAVLICLLLRSITSAVNAAGPVYFCGVNDTLATLSEQTIPRYFAGEIYLPFTVFTVEDTGIGVFCAVSDELDSLLLYTADKRLRFDVSGATIYDQDNVQYSYAAKGANGTVYLPAEFVCSFFGLTLAVLQYEPASVIRIKNETAVYNDATFLGIYRDDMASAYHTHIGDYGEQEASATGATNAPDDSALTFEQVTVYLTFSELAPGQLDLLLDILDTSDYSCGIFVAADEINDNAELIRRAAGSGHMIGLKLVSGTYDEYKASSELLFEAAKIKTLFISADDEAARQAAATASSKGLIFWNTTCLWSEITQLTLTDITTDIGMFSIGAVNLRFSCSETIPSVIPGLLTYLADYKYHAPRITETSRLPV